MMCCWDAAKCITMRKRSKSLVSAMFLILHAWMRCRAAFHCCMHEQLHGSSQGNIASRGSRCSAMAALRMPEMHVNSSELDQPLGGRTSGAISKWKRPSSDASTAV